MLNSQYVLTSIKNWKITLWKDKSFREHQTAYYFPTNWGIVKFIISRRLC